MLTSNDRKEVDLRLVKGSFVSDSMHAIYEDSTSYVFKHRLKWKSDKTKTETCHRSFDPLKNSSVKIKKEKLLQRIL